jgi:hypothetical protein
VTGPQEVFLRKGDGTVLAGALISGIDEPYARRVDDAWLTSLAAIDLDAAARGETIARPEHVHWVWGDKVKHLGRLISCPTYSIECDGAVQGMLTLVTDGHYCKLPEQVGSPLVYVWFLASAPWNLLLKPGPDTYHGVGNSLMSVAIQSSIALGFKGRIGLHSLPQAESYYQQMPMICLGPDNSKQGMNYFEMTPDLAKAFISTRR